MIDPQVLEAFNPQGSSACGASMCGCDGCGNSTNRSNLAGNRPVPEKKGPRDIPPGNTWADLACKSQRVTDDEWDACKQGCAEEFERTGEGGRCANSCSRRFDAATGGCVLVAGCVACVEALPPPGETETPDGWDSFFR